MYLQANHGELRNAYTWYTLLCFEPLHRLDITGFVYVAVLRTAPVRKLCIYVFVNVFLFFVVFGATCVPVRKLPIHHPWEQRQQRWKTNLCNGTSAPICFLRTS